jgi:hypothetical protein
MKTACLIIPETWEKLKYIFSLSSNKNNARLLMPLLYLSLERPQRTLRRIKAKSIPQWHHYTC